MKCPRCGTETADASGIGPYCPNNNCDADDDLRPDWQTQHDAMMRTIHDAAERHASMEWARKNLSVLASLRAGTHVVVPREPTEAMLSAAETAYADEPGFVAGVLAEWRAMIAAAQPRRDEGDGA